MLREWELDQIVNLMVIENFTVVNIHEEKETKECGLTSAENLLNNLL